MENKTKKRHFEVPRGMRDFYPENVEVRNSIFSAWRQSALQFGFIEYDGPIVESLDLLQSKSGDGIADQIYSFSDKSNRKIALRPEMTPTLARMIAAKQSALTFPLKWFSIAQCFRYERMSRGRKREHYQWNLDIVGEPALTAEVDVIACALQALSHLGLGVSDVCVYYSSRALLSDLLLTSGIPKQLHLPTFRVLDKRAKLNESAIVQLLKDSELEERHIKAIFKLTQIRSLEEASDILGETTPSLTTVQNFASLLSTYGIVDKMKFDIGIIRGLDYYTGIVFEAFDTERKFRAIFGGGRYDRLLEDVGARAMTAVGLGFGDVVLMDFLSGKGVQLHYGYKTDYAVSYFEDAQQKIAIQIAQALRANGKSVDMALHSEKPKHFFARVGKGNINEAIFIGPDDIRSGIIRVKDLGKRVESEIQLSELLP